MLHGLSLAWRLTCQCWLLAYAANRLKQILSAAWPLHDHDKYPEVRAHFNVVPQGWLLSLARHGHVEPLCGGGVPAQQLQARRRDDKQNGGHDHGYSPGCVSFHSRACHGVKEDGNHEDLRDTTAQISPSGCCSVRCSNHIGREHQGTPELVGHESGSFTRG